MSDEWVLRYEGLDPKQEGLREALCTLGNGVFATRGAAEEQQAGAVSPLYSHRAPSGSRSRCSGVNLGQVAA